jgi:hypothetical protein
LCWWREYFGEFLQSADSGLEPNLANLPTLSGSAQMLVPIHLSQALVERSRSPLDPSNPVMYNSYLKYMDGSGDPLIERGIKRGDTWI